MNHKTTKRLCDQLNISELQLKILNAYSEHHPRTLLEVYSVWVVCEKSFDIMEKVLQRELATAGNAVEIYYKEFRD